MREGNKSQAAAFKSIMLGGDSWVTCNEAVTGDMGLETLQVGGINLSYSCGIS